MPSIMIKCPTTGNDVPTGMAMDEKSFADESNRFSGNSFQCPSCGAKHTWDKKDAWVAKPN